MTGTRVLTAAVLIPVVVGIVLWAPAGVVAACVAGVTLIALREFFGLAELAGFRGFPRWTALTALLLVLAEWAPSVCGTSDTPGFLGVVLSKFPADAEAVFLIFVLGAAIITLARRQPVTQALPGVASSAAGLLFIAWPLSHIVRLHGKGSLDGPKLVLMTLVMVWVGDSVAYFVGRAVGRHKMAPVISPNKTWEGAVANAVGSIIAGVAFREWLPTIHLAHLVAVALLVSVAGQLGDLLESAWKRGAGVKDSGSLLPGHGGMLDRIDALIFAAPVVWWYFWWFVWR